MGVPVCQGCRDRDRIIVGLEQRVSTLEARVKSLTQQLEQAVRAGKRQAAPFSKGPPMKEPKRPGRKAGKQYGAKGHRPAPPPEKIDEVYEAPLPEQCPDCAGPIAETHIAQQYQTEIPRKAIHRQFNVHVGECQDCHRRVQGHHPLQTSDALGAAASQLGPDAQAGIVELNKHAGLSHGKIVQCLEDFFGISLTRGASAHTVLRLAQRCEPVYATIRQCVRRSRWVAPDETGWRVGGILAWLHGLVTKWATVYAIDPTRSSQVAEDILGLAYSGVMIHDGWSPYDAFANADHQQCLQHLLRRCEEILQTATGGAVCVPRDIQEILGTALKLRDRYEAGEVSDHGLAIARSRLEYELSETIRPIKTNPENERLAKHLRKHCDDLFTFLYKPVDATNWRAEHAMRFGVILRKVWGGNRTWRGARAQAVLMSVWRTCWQRAAVAMDFVSHLLRDRTIPLPLPP